MPFLSNYVLNNRGNFRLQFLRRFKDIAIFVVGYFSLPHSVQFSLQDVLWLIHQVM